jgi:cytochrome c-type biogenesis protein CcmF
LFVFASAYVLLQQNSSKWIYGIASFLTLLFAFTFNIFPSYTLISWGIITSAFIVISYVKSFPKDNSEDQISSREFWMFVGSLMLVMSAVIISLFTSTPIFNKLLGQKSAPIDVFTYNKWSLPFALIIMLLTGFAQFLKYRKTDMKKFYKSLWVSIVLSLAIGLTAAFALYSFKAYDLAPEKQKSYYFSYAVLLVACVFSVFANVDYWLKILKGKIKSAGASIAHIGFALIILGALISTSKKVTLSKNSSRKNVEALGKEYSNSKSLLLTQGDTLKMGPYYASFAGKKRDGIHILYEVNYFTKKDNGQLEKAFDLFPRVQLNERMGNAAEPDTRHFIDKDIYTHVTYADLNTINQTERELSGFTDPTNNIIHLGDTIFTSNSFVILDSLSTSVNKEQYEKNDSAITVTAVLRAVNIENKQFKSRPKYRLQENSVIPISDSIADLGLKFVFWKINPDNGSIEIQHSERKSNQRDFIVMEAYLFPFINILWLGCFVMAFGTCIAIVYRIKQLKKTIN